MTWFNSDILPLLKLSTMPVDDLYSTPGVPNQSIAIYRSIFKCLAVDRGWFYACTYILIKIFQNINWNNYAFVHFLYFQFGIFPLFKINFLSTVLYLLSYINNITVIIVVVYDITFSKNFWNNLHWADLLISSLFQSVFLG